MGEKGGEGGIGAGAQGLGTVGLPSIRKLGGG